MSENIKIYKKTEEGYPKNLLQLPDAPSRLYVLGELPDPMRPAIAIVGARNCSSYGKNMAYEYARILTQTGQRCGCSSSCGSPGSRWKNLWCDGMRGGFLLSYIQQEALPCYAAAGWYFVRIRSWDPTPFLSFSTAQPNHQRSLRGDTCG